MPLRRLCNLFYSYWMEAQRALRPQLTHDELEDELASPVGAGGVVGVRFVIANLADYQAAERDERARKARENRSGFAALARAFSAA